MRKTKSALSVILALVLMLSMSVTAFAAEGDPVEVITAGGTGETAVEVTIEPTNFRATVPFVLPVDLAADGTITVAQSGLAISSIINECPLGGIVVVGLDLVEANGWTLEDFTADYKNMKVNSLKYGFQINNENIDPTTKSVALVEAHWPVIANGGSLQIQYDAKLPGFSQAVPTTKIGGVVFTLDFDKVVVEP